MSINRSMFYVWADKIGTQTDEKGAACVYGNYAPCWVPGGFKYQVVGRWPENLWKQRKLTHKTYDDYLFLCRDNVLGRKRNLEAVREREQEEAQNTEIQANTKRLRDNPALYQEWPQVPAAQAWLALFGKDAFRYPLLVVLGASFTGKTEWAKSLFKNYLELKIGNLTHFPDTMRLFDKQKHDGLVLDDVRDLEFLSDNQDKLQGKYDARVEFASTPGGACSFKKYLFAVPTVVTCNFSTKNLHYLETHDWLKHPGNRVVVKFPDVLRTTYCDFF